MISRQQSTMAEVTRLTRAGRLAEAMDLLAGRSSEDAAPAPVRRAGLGLPRLDHDVLGSNRFQDMNATDSHRIEHDVVRKPVPPFRPRALAEALAGSGPAPLMKGAALRWGQADADPLAEGARFEAGTFTNRAGRRAFRLYVPARSAGTAMPLVVMLHGCQQSPEDFATGTQMNRVAEEQGFAVVYPEQSSAANQSRCWNWFVPGDQARESGEPSLIAGITRQVMDEIAVDPARVYIAGLSAGGAQAAIMGAAYPDLYAAVGVHSGLACGAARDMSSAFSAMQGGGAASPASIKQPLPTIVFHGDRDHTVNMVNGDRVIAQSKGSTVYEGSVSQGRSAGGIAYTRTVHADRSGHPTLEHWVLHGVGHAWSGGSSAGSYTEPRGPDASREMIRFFLEQSGPGEGAR